jgi:hypothetical protein
MSETAQKVEFGDFQTPFATTTEICKALKRSGIRPKTVIEPTCGKGSFLASSLEVFSGLERSFGFDVNEGYLREARTTIASRSGKSEVHIERRSFFETDWTAFTKGLPQPVLFLGNPPWVTNSTLGKLKSENLPQKKNDAALKGLDALTGKSNFDISEWMMCRMLDAIQGTTGIVAMLCKTSVARKVLKYAHDNSRCFGDAHLYQIDSKAIFSVSVDACLFTFSAGSSRRDYTCDVFDSIEASASTYRFGFVDGKLVANVEAYTNTRELDGFCQIKWRSGLKHDCSSVMELQYDRGSFINGNREAVQIEDAYIFPLLKSSDLTKRPLPLGRKMVIVTQKSIGEDTGQICGRAPKLWKYLSKNEEKFAARKSSIYKNKPPFSIFGIGSYSFAPWKVAISGLYKQSKFSLLGPHEGKAVMLDDTCYFLPFESEGLARKCHKYLNSDVAQNFLRSIVFWDAKRPINADLLQRISLGHILGEQKQKKDRTPKVQQKPQLSLGI